MRIPRLIVVLTLIVPRGTTLAQEAPPPEHQHPGSSPEPPQNAWSWTGDANVIFGYNYQNRKFTDFSVWESQNWFVLNDISHRGWGRIGAGADMTAYHVPQNMLDNDGAPLSFHVFLRYRPTTHASMGHMH
jgi:hypothetical protein